MEIRAHRLLVVLLAGCGGASATTGSAPTPTSASAGPASAPPISARFVDLAEGASVTASCPCDTRFVAIAHGKATVGADSLGEGDVLVVRGGADVAVRGEGLGLVAVHHPASCDITPSPIHRVARAAEAPELTFAKGGMHAHLDLPSEVSPDVYFGRLSGVAPVAEHQHDVSWEVLCAVEAAGTLTVAGVDQRVGAKQCSFVPPATKHSWKPDPGSNLVAFQMYTPPGPEQRFKKLATAETAPR